MADVVQIYTNSSGKSAPRAVIGVLADRQHGTVARWQLRRLGIEIGVIDYLVATAYLIPVQWGVYAVGHRRLTSYGRAMAAVLSCGPGAVLSHRSAAWLWNLLTDGRAVWDVTTPARNRRSRGSVRVHNPRGLHSTDTGTIDGIPVTSLARTLLDVAETESERIARRAYDQAERLRLLDLTAVKEQVGRGRGRRGLAPLLSLIAKGNGHVHDTRSNPERRLVELLREHDLPEPSMNVVVAGHCVDAYWPDHDVVGEVDPYTYHHTPRDVESDIQRDLDLKLAGYELVRIPARVEAALPLLERLLG